MKIAAIVWGSDATLLSKAAEAESVGCAITRTHKINDPDALSRFYLDQKDADIILLHPSQHSVWDDLIPSIRSDIPIISFGYDQAFWRLSNVPIKLVAAVSAYATHGGEENYRRMIRLLSAVVAGDTSRIEEPHQLPWEGIYHPDAPDTFLSPEEYLAWRPKRHPSRVGIVFSRAYWANGDILAVDALIREIETFADVITIFCLSGGDLALGARSGPEVAGEWFGSDVDLIINLQPVFRSGDQGVAEGCFERLDCPVIHPLLLYHQSQEEWLTSTLGLPPMECAWSVALPEMQGMIEMLPFGSEEGEIHLPIPERIDRITNRVRSWLTLRAKDPADRKIAFILHNKPCSSVEATVGAGAHLDTLESTARILHVMQAAGYRVFPPADGDELIGTILDRRAISDFRWTTVSSIVRSGGALALIGEEEYRGWFSELDPMVRSQMVAAWGEPPGEEIDGIPPAMVHEGQIIVTGVSYGNAVVCVQPKRGCAGSRCDGSACKILHDPEVPPTHQYLATYRWLERVFGADLVIHVGTHGNLEFLPGKSAAPSGRCFPDLMIGSMPHLYIYNADNPPEGTIAKRRAAAVLISHMQTVMQASGLYGELKELETLLDEYTRAEADDPARAHSLQHLIADAVTASGLSEEIGMPAGHDGFSEYVLRLHRSLGEIASSRIPDGMHIFGERPSGEDRIRFIHAAARFDDAISAALFGPGYGNEPLKNREESEYAFVTAILSGATDADAVLIACGRPPLPGTAAQIALLRELIRSLEKGIKETDEIAALLHGMEGGFIQPGPSGLITRGRPDILPTGRNFYSLDPATVPTKAAWMVGKRLADALIATYREEHGEYPRSVAMYWQSTDLMWADGEQFAAILHLIGVEPIWRSGRVVSFRIIPIEELGRPRIDLTIRVSAILRDCFFSSIELLDSAFSLVSALDEPDEGNPIRAHTRESGTSRRLFSSRPGTYGNGVNLAVFASAWREEKDLAEIFIEWNGYSYGNGDAGTIDQSGFSALLSTVQATFNKTSTDEYDLTGCCCYFGIHGGMTAAARHLSDHPVESYYGDTRTPSQVEVRTLAAEIQRVVRSKILNPVWIEGMRRHGYKGGGDIAKRVGTIYGWEASTGEVDDRIFDDITKTFVLDEENRTFFREQNPFALEEIGRRLLEAEARGLWKPDPEISEGLRETYLEVEGWLEDRLDGSDGEMQGGGIHIMTMDEIRRKRSDPSR
ncbi:cobaltochelatase subunit CobN [Methanocalculus sp.]|uniref:cobaltochelatase subunit CobN n=1 Tax=Methanocalculus sp. TaxID=2004547 RepID=UPI00272827B3|nr:cobaltochelatase subunit CobN [Methanocalculus sp.]MDO8841665.1 cobaltochelatase subunit CobN [Methanocalculus sp.]